jgi:cellulose synthase/poly-beta-1,6-N-acetylglucosamine synthase-like glycosyltransferase
MLAFLIPVIFFFLNYVYLIFSFLRGWSKLENNNKTQLNQTTISIIIPFRNEQNNLNSLLNNLKKQSYPNSRLEILFINDHSTDRSVDIITQNDDSANKFKLLHLNENETGKKQAIRKGFNNSNGELLITLDADCVPGIRWLESMAKFYQHYDPDMIIAPVIMSPGNTYLSRIFSLEFKSLLASTAGAAGHGQPIMCNGANLAFKKSVVHELSDIYKHPSASGDDIFLLEAMKRTGKSIRFCKSHESCVYTDAPATIRHFMRQRIRWLSKSKHYKDFSLRYVAISVFLLNLGILGLLIGAIIYYEFIFFYLGILTLKSIVDFALLAPVIKHFNMETVLKFRYFLPIQLLYPFYILVVAVLSQISGYTWKERRYKETLIDNMDTKGHE